MSYISNINRLKRKIWGIVVGRPRNFAWIIEKRLAIFGRPYTLKEVRWLLNHDIISLLLLTENNIDLKLKKQFKLFLHLPIRDHGVPNKKQLNRALRFIHKNIVDGNTVGVACEIGKGRSATIVALYLCYYKKYDVGNAIKYIRSRSKNAIELLQEQFIYHIAKASHKNKRNL